MVFDAPTPAPAAAVIRDHLQRIHRRYGKELPGGARFEIRAIWPDKERSTVPRTFPATEAGFEAATEHAVDMNGQGTNIYVTVNALRPDMPEHKGAKDADIIAGIFQFADFDDSYGAGNARAMRALSLDTFSVITGTIPHERLHLYFERSEPCTDMEEWKETQKAIAARLGSDATVCNPSRIMRLAGAVSYPSKSKTAQGYVIELTTLSDGSGRRLSAGELRSEFPSVGGGRKAPAKAKDREIPATGIDTAGNIDAAIA